MNRCGCCGQSVDRPGAPPLDAALCDKCNAFLRSTMPRVPQRAQPPTTEMLAAQVKTELERELACRALALETSIRVQERVLKEQIARLRAENVRLMAAVALGSMREPDPGPMYLEGQMAAGWGEE